MVSDSTSDNKSTKIRVTFQGAVNKYRLLNHPFYQAWSCGELPREALVKYAQEYGAFVERIGEGWSTLGDSETCQEEQEHAELWEKFAETLGTSIGPVVSREMQDLLAVSSSLFSSPETAVGALYAFEVQQPETATSKLEGLRSFYPVDVKGERYFEEHAKNHHEAVKLEERITRLSAAQQAVALQACERMAKALYDGLTGIHGTLTTNSAKDSPIGSLSTN